ncbi:HTH domain-containing protein [Haloarcula salina]|uniref:Uncharacterized protein n=1 Tax=Haloarcula salina TaxID=1429914 RepID=A0AA41KEZ8_9EURY|nr:HTH domain-containing protein [Haloarcula salina]MBV0901527.1 hypothetical protein [Haloarcula salina]
MPEKMQRTDDDPFDDVEAGTVTVRLWSRRPVCGPRTTVIDRLTELRAAGVLDDVEIQTWPEEIAVSEHSVHSDVLDTVERYETWASERGLSLRPPFETRTSSLLVGGSKEVLRTPMLVAAAYEGDELLGVYPCTDGTSDWSITDFLDALEGGLTELPHESPA